MLRHLSTYAKPILLAIIVYTCLSIAIPQEAQAWSVKRILSIGDIRQQKPNWCWAASAQAVIHYKTTSRPDQCHLVWLAKQYRYEKCPDFTGTVYDVSFLLRKYGLNQADALEGTLSITQIQSEIDAYRPIVAAWWTSWFGGHMVVIRGYYRDNYGNTVYYLDPDPSSNGGFKTASYEWFKRVENHHTWNFTVFKAAP